MSLIFENQNILTKTILVSMVLSKRFSDFNVYEIDKSMTIVHLGDQKFPDEGVVDQNIEYDDHTQAEKALISEILFSRV